MGTLFRKYCPTCDRDTETNVTFDGFAGAAITNSRQGGEIVSLGYLAYIADDGDLVPLPHPIESCALHAAGATWTRATIHGRLLRITNLICTDCGAQNTTATLDTGGIGCVPSLLLVGIAIACNILVFSFHPIIEAFLVWMAVFTPPWLIDRYVWLRYRGNVRPHQTDRCNLCGGRHVLSLANARNSSLCCPRCKQKTMTIEVAGRS